MSPRSEVSAQQLSQISPPKTQEPPKDGTIDILPRPDTG
jgi:hypothetical protein